MSKNHDRSFSAWNALVNLFAIPCNFLTGFIVGLVAPVAAIAAMVVGIRLITGRVPFPTPVPGEGEERRLSLELVPLEQAGELFVEQKGKIGADLSKLQAEIRAIVEESKSHTRAEGKEAPTES